MLYKLTLIRSCLKQLYICKNKMEHFSYKLGVLCVGMHISRQRWLGLQINGFGLQVIYHMVGKFGGGKVWQI